MRVAVAIFLFLVSLSASAEICYVAFVKGKIMKDGTVVRVGDTLDVRADTALEFSASSDIVVVVMPGKGRYIIRPKTVRTSQNKLWLLVKENLIPCTQKNSLTARGTTFDLSESLKGGRLAFFQRMSISIDKSFWTERENNYFYLQYNVDKERIEKKLMFQEPEQPSDTLKIILDNDIFMVDDKKVSSKHVSDMALYFFQKDAGQAIKIKDITVVNLSEETVFPEIKNAYLLIRAHLHQDLSSVTSELEAHIEEFYGRTDKVSMLALLAVLNREVAK